MRDAAQSWVCRSKTAKPSAISGKVNFYTINGWSHASPSTYVVSCLRWRRQTRVLFSVLRRCCNV